MEIDWQMLMRGVAAVLITGGIVIIFLIVEAYFEIGRELPVRHTHRAATGHAEPPDGRRAS
jgi:hypothetical protein